MYNHLDSLIDEVKEDIELHADGYQLDTDVLAKLKTSGRVSIEMTVLGPYIRQLLDFIHNSEPEDLVWNLTINRINGQFEITLKNLNIKL